MSVIMRLFAPPSMADERITQTSPTATNDLFPTSRPVEAWLAMIRRKGDKESRTVWRLSPWAESYEDMRSAESLRPFYSNLRSTRITQRLLACGNRDWPV